MYVYVCGDNFVDNFCISFNVIHFTPYLYTVKQPTRSDRVLLVFPVRFDIGLIFNLFADNEPVDNWDADEDTLITPDEEVSKVDMSS